MKQLINEAKRMQFLAGLITESQLNQVIKRIIKKKTELNEIGMMRLTKIKYDSPKNMSDEEKMETVKRMQNAINGRIAVEFSPDEWYDWEGKIENIDEYENDVNQNLYGRFGSFKDRMKMK